jgi:hypothetical protein
VEVRSRNFLWIVYWLMGSWKKSMRVLKSFFKKLKLLEGSKLVLARMFTDRMPSRRNFMARVGVRPGASGSRKLPSESLMRPWELPWYRPV